MTGWPGAGILRSLAIYYGQPWKRRRMDALYRRFVKPGDLCFDVGAHVGNRVACFRRLGARVVALEPQPACVEVLERLYGADEGVTLLAVGVGDQLGTAELAIASRYPTLSTFSAGWRAERAADPAFAGISWDSTVTVEIVTMDTLIGLYGEPAFAKIDVEGFELEVLRGLSRPLAALSFEFLPGSTRRALDCVERLETLGGYRYLVTLAETQRLQWSDPRDADGIRRFLESPGPRSGDVFAIRSR